MKSFALHGLDGGGETWRELSAGHNDVEPADYCSRDGAHALKQKIEAYWRERGQDVMLQLHNVGFHPAIRAARYDVRSDMINGMPRGSIDAAVGKSQDCHKVSLVETDDDDVWIDD